MNQNSNQSVMDPFLTNNYKVNLNEYYNPINKIKLDTTLNERFKINAPAGYLPSEISIYHGGKLSNKVPILFPESFSESLSASYASESPVGSDRPIIAFSNTNAKKVPFTFIALADYLPEGFTSLKQYLNTIQTMCRPKYEGQTVLSPSVLLTFVNLKYEAVCDDIQIGYSTVYGNKQFVMATLSCTFTILKEL